MYVFYFAPSNEMHQQEGGRKLDFYSLQCINLTGIQTIGRIDTLQQMSVKGTLSNEMHVKGGR